MPSVALAEKPSRTIVKQEKYVTLYSDQSMIVKNVRASYPHLVTPFKDGQKLSLKTLMPKTPDYAPSAKIIIAEINRVMQEMKVQLPSDRKFMQNGDLLGNPDYAGHYLISASEVRRPALRGRGEDPTTGRAKVLTPEEAGRIFYGGCWVNELIRPWPQNNGFGKRVNANLLAVQFVKDDEPFGEGTRIGEDEIDESFGAIDDDDSGYDDGLSDDDDL
jgi:hypothetical protein